MTQQGTSGPADMPPLLRAFIKWVEHLVQWLSRHWLGVLNLMFLLYVGLPFLAPVLMHLGAETPARLIYLIYRPACHQLPERSYFLFGQAPIYDLSTLPQDGVANAHNLLVRRTYIGDPQHGYKVAICERDVAIYGAMFLMGLLFALRRQRLHALSWRQYMLFVLPMAIDGITQLVGLHHSNWLLRTITGALFGVGTVWFVYPYLAQSMRNASKTLKHTHDVSSDLIK